jgi:hypothetical protein
LHGRFTVADEDGGGTYSYLVKDYSLDCAQARYAQYLPFCYLQMLIYPLGIPLMYAAMLFQSRTYLKDSKFMDKEMANGYPLVRPSRLEYKTYVMTDPALRGGGGICPRNTYR